MFASMIKVVWNGFEYKLCSRSSKQMSFSEQKIKIGRKRVNLDSLTYHQIINDSTLPYWINVGVN